MQHLSLFFFLLLPIGSINLSHLLLVFFSSFFVVSRSLPRVAVCSIDLKKGPTHFYFLIGCDGVAVCVRYVQYSERWYWELRSLLIERVTGGEKESAHRVAAWLGSQRRCQRIWCQFRFSSYCSWLTWLIIFIFSFLFFFCRCWFPASDSSDPHRVNSSASARLPGYGVVTT